MARYNPQHQAVKRIMADIKELRRDPSPNYFAQPLESDQFDWHFTIRGPPDTPFEGGIYHGRILLPTQYPMKPPNIVFFTPNGRFKTNMKVCLSISAYHPEQWHPAWGVRLMLEAIITFLPTPAEGAVGSLDFSDEERAKMAKESLAYRCPHCGDPAKLLPVVKDEAKACMKAKAYRAEISRMQFAAPNSATLVRGQSAANDASAAPAAAAAPATASPAAPAAAPATAPAAAAATSTAAVIPQPVPESEAPTIADTQPQVPVQVPAPTPTDSQPTPPAQPAASAVAAVAASAETAEETTGLRHRGTGQQSVPEETPETAGNAETKSDSDSEDEVTAPMRSSPEPGDVCLVLFATLIFFLIVMLVSRKIVMLVLSFQ